MCFALVDTKCLFCVVCRCLTWAFRVDCIDICGLLLGCYVVCFRRVTWWSVDWFLCLLLRVCGVPIVNCLLVLAVVLVVYFLDCAFVGGFVSY